MEADPNPSPENNMKKSYIIGASLLAVIVIVAIVVASNSSVVPSISVQDQKDVSGEIIVSEIVSVKPGWLVIQTNDEGVPGSVIGYVKINAGSNRDVKVKVDVPKATATLYAMIHEDDGTKDKFDFPENDLPLMYKMEMVAKVFKLN
jgi:hypothetical protein